jgi:hypothetical protein
VGVLGSPEQESYAVNLLCILVLRNIPSSFTQAKEAIRLFIKASVQKSSTYQNVIV